jgi:3-dehydroquinate dehydratase II
VLPELRGGPALDDVHSNAADDRNVRDGTLDAGDLERLLPKTAGDRQVRRCAPADWVHEAIDNGAGIIINPAAYTFTSLALFDALKMFPGPIIELHISNIHKRESHYHNSYVSKVATAIIAGLGAKGYPAAVRAIRDLIG